MIYNVGVSPASICIVGRLAYIANSNNYGISGADSVTVIDLKNKKVLTTIYDPSFDEPYRIGFYKDKVYVCNSAGDSISIIKDFKVISVITGFNGPSGISISRQGIAYISNYGINSGTGNTISVVDLNCGNIINTINVGLAPVQPVLKDDMLYVISYNDGNPGTGLLQVISIDTNTIIKSISGFSGPFGLVVSKHHAYITNFGSNNFAPFGTTVSIVNLKDRSMDNISVGIQPAGIVKVGNKLYVSNYNTLYGNPITFNNITYGKGTISVICLKKKQVINTIAVEQTPSYLTYADGQLYSTSYIGNVISEIDIC